MPGQLNVTALIDYTAGGIVGNQRHCNKVRAIKPSDLSEVKAAVRHSAIGVINAVGCQDLAR